MEGSTADSASFYLVLRWRILLDEPEAGAVRQRVLDALGGYEWVQVFGDMIFILGQGANDFPRTFAELNLPLSTIAAENNPGFSYVLSPPLPRKHIWAGSLPTDWRAVNELTHEDFETLERTLLAPRAGIAGTSSLGGPAAADEPTQAESELGPDDRSS